MRVRAELTDPTHLKLDHPLPLPSGSRVLVDVRSPDAEHDEVTGSSSCLLNRAYGDDEPDYSKAGKPIGPSE